MSSEPAGRRRAPVPGEAVEAGGGAHSARERPLGGAADDRPVGERVREREADLDQVGASVDRGLRELGRLWPRP